MSLAVQVLFTARSGRLQDAYRYVLAQQPPASSAADTSGGRDWVAALAIGLGLAAAAVCGLVLWAHS